MPKSLKQSKSHNQDILLRNHLLMTLKPSGPGLEDFLVSTGDGVGGSELSLPLEI